MTVLPAMLVRLEKAANDNGFDRELPPQVNWLSFESSHAPLGLWLTTGPDGLPIAALSRSDVAKALADHGFPVAVSLPTGAISACAVPDVPALHRLLRRAYQLARSLPNELLHLFEQQTAALPRSTEAERLVIQRRGQDIFREGLIDYWEGRCAITGLSVERLLRASHIKPWSVCATDAERLDVFNGLLLAPHLDAVFDAGFITFADNGVVIVAPSLPARAQELLGLTVPLSLTRVAEPHLPFLNWHRTHEFQKHLKR